MTGQSQIIFHLRYDVNVIYLFPEVGFDVVFLLFNAKRKIDCNSILATDYHNVYPPKNFRCECCCDSCCCLFFFRSHVRSRKILKTQTFPSISRSGLDCLGISFMGSSDRWKHGHIKYDNLHGWTIKAHDLIFYQMFSVDDFTTHVVKQLFVSCFRHRSVAFNKLIRLMRHM